MAVDRADSIKKRFLSVPVLRWMKQETPSRARTLVTSLIIFCVAVAVRCVVLKMQVAHYPERWSTAAPLSDLAEIGNIALNIYEGRGFSSPFIKGSIPTAWECPAIPYLYALVIRCAGAANGQTAQILGYLYTIPSSAAVVVYWLIARHVHRKIGRLTSFTALGVAAVFCFWPESIITVENLWYFAWQELGVAFLVLLAIRWIDRPDFRRVLPLAFIGGLLALINITPIPIFAVALFLPVFFAHANRARIFRYAAGGAMLALMIVSPWLIRNTIALGAIVPLRANGGFQLWEGNNSNPAIRDTYEPEHPANLGAEFQQYQALGEAEYSRQRATDALNYIAAHPLKTVARTGERIYVMWLTDTFDNWPVLWFTGTSLENKGGWQRIRHPKAFITTVFAWGTVLALAWVIFTGRWRSLPYKSLFASVIFFLPLPHYFTVAGDAYSQILRTWLVLVIILAIRSHREINGLGNWPVSPPDVDRRR